MVKEIIEYRWARDAPWKESAMQWTAKDLGFLNKVCGYAKYRVRYVAA